MGGRKSRSGLSRRSLLRNIGMSSVGALAATPALSMSRTPADSRPDKAGEKQSAPAFVHGVASGDPLVDRVMIWTRVSSVSGGECAVDWEVSARPDFAKIIAAGTFITGAHRDHTVKIDVPGLQAGTTYYYRFRALGQDSDTGRTRTLPAAGVDHLRFAVMSCSSYPHGFFNAYARVAQRPDLDCVIHLGDYIYEYGNNGYGSKVQAGGRIYDPPHELLSLADYRRRHSLYKRDRDLQRCHQQHPFICVWDDHELSNDAWSGGAHNHQPGEGSWPDRSATARRVYNEWMPIRLPEPGNDARIYRRFHFGGLVDLIMLDTRFVGRAEQLEPNGETLPDIGFKTFTDTGEFADTGRDLLGEEQQGFLQHALQSADASWKLLGQQVMFGQLKIKGAANSSNTRNPGGQGGQFLNPDQWDGYPRSRERVWNVLRGKAAGTDAAIDNVVVLTGDIHTAWSMNITEDPNNPDPAAGGYDASTGEGSMAVEFVTTSVTSPGPRDTREARSRELYTENPHLQYVNLAEHGYLLLDITPQRCQGEHWYLDSVLEPVAGETFAAAYFTAVGSNRLQPGTISAAKDPATYGPLATLSVDAARSEAS